MSESTANTKSINDDVAGHTPALSCAPTMRVADCLAIILAHMPFPATPNNNIVRAQRSEGHIAGFGECLPG